MFLCRECASEFCAGCLSAHANVRVSLEAKKLTDTLVAGGDERLIYFIARSVTLHFLNLITAKDHGECSLIVTFTRSRSMSVVTHTNYIVLPVSSHLM